MKGRPTAWKFDGHYGWKADPLDPETQKITFLLPVKSPFDDNSKTEVTLSVDKDGTMVLTSNNADLRVSSQSRDTAYISFWDQR